MTPLLFKRKSYIQAMPDDLLKKRIDASKETFVYSLIYTMFAGGIMPIIYVGTDPLPVPGPITSIQQAINNLEYTPDTQFQWNDNAGHLVRSTAGEQQKIAQKQLEATRTQIQERNIKNAPMHKGAHIAFYSASVSLGLFAYFLARGARLGLENHRRKKPQPHPRPERGFFSALQ